MTSYAPTCADIEAAVFAKLRLDTTADQAKTNAWVNAALCKIAVETRCFSGSSTGAALAAAASSQALPAAIIELEYVTALYGGQNVLLREVTFDRILTQRQQVGSSGPPYLYALRSSTVEFWPSALGGEVLTYYGANMPSLIATSSVIPAPMVEPFSKVLEYGALVEGAEFKKDPLLGEYRQLYDVWMARFQVYLNRRQGATPGAFEVWGSASKMTPHDPSSDWNLTGPWQQ